MPPDRVLGEGFGLGQVDDDGVGVGVPDGGGDHGVEDLHLLAVRLHVVDRVAAFFDLDDFGVGRDAGGGLLLASLLAGDDCRDGGRRVGGCRCDDGGRDLLARMNRH